MKNTILLCGMVLLLATQSCKKANDTDNDTELPTACLFTNGLIRLENENFDFSVNCQSGAESYLWDFGDGTTSTLSAPSHAYSAVGAYNVELTVTNAAGSTDSTFTVYTAYSRITDFVGMYTTHTTCTNPTQVSIGGTPTGDYGRVMVNGTGRKLVGIYMPIDTVIIYDFDTTINGVSPIVGGAKINRGLDTVFIHYVVGTDTCRGFWVKQ